MTVIEHKAKMPTQSKTPVWFTVPEPGIELPYAGGRLPAGRHPGVKHLTVYHLAAGDKPNLAVTIDTPTMTITITAEYQAGLIREDRNA